MGWNHHPVYHDILSHQPLLVTWRKRRRWCSYKLCRGDQVAIWWCEISSSPCWWCTKMDDILHHMNVALQIWVPIWVGQIFWSFHSLWHVMSASEIFWTHGMLDAESWWVVKIFNKPFSSSKSQGGERGNWMNLRAGILRITSCHTPVTFRRYDEYFPQLQLSHEKNPPIFLEKSSYFLG